MIRAFEIGLSAKFLVQFYWKVIYPMYMYGFYVRITGVVYNSLLINLCFHDSIVDNFSAKDVSVLRCEFDRTRVMTIKF